MLKKFPLDKIIGTKYVLFLSRAPTHHSFTFNILFNKMRGLFYFKILWFRLKLK